MGCCCWPPQRALRSMLTLKLIDCCCSDILPLFSLAASIWLAIIALCDIFYQSSFRSSVFDCSLCRSLWGRKVCANDGGHRTVSLKSPSGVVVAPILLLVIFIESSVCFNDNETWQVVIFIQSKLILLKYSISTKH